jgi:hypothetical protein
MRRFFVVSLSCASLLAALAALPSEAGAKPLRHAHHAAPAHVTHYVVDSHTGAPPLTVRGRSFLDPGNVVPVGSQNAYVAESTTFNRTTDQLYARSKFGNETLPGPFDLPGRQEPLFEFSTGGYGD